ncbi:MAG TPA: PQ-loop domain-containing transporter [Nocardioidaceae bacterium]|nr:PQ-loop domain-containing transporter [Nocardioidaceae bacterium]
MSVVMLVGAVAAALSVYATVPQVLRAARTRSVEGVSWSSTLLSLGTMTLWAVYAVAVSDAMQIVNNTLALLLLAALAVVVMRAGVPSSAWLPVAIVFATALASIWVVDVANSFTLAMVGTVASSMRMLPQTRLAVSGAPLWGLCPWSVLLAWSGTALWLLYALMAWDVALAICCSVLLVMQTVVVVYRLPLRRTLASLAAGRLGRPVARVAAPLSQRLPQRRVEVELAA